MVLTTEYQRLAQAYLGNTGYGDVYIRIYAKYNSQNIANNTTNVSFQARLRLYAGNFSSTSGTSYRITGSGDVDSGTKSCNGSFSEGETTLGTITKDISHNTDGTRTIHAEAQFISNPWGWNATAKAEGIELPSIPRYATANQSLNSKTETSIKMNWSSDSVIDGIWYSIDNGANWNWVHDPRATSGTYTISGLSANTTYNIKTRVKKLDNQLTTDSGTTSVKTYAYPYCTNAPSFTIGNNVKLDFYNPLNRTIQIQMWSHKGSTFVSDLITISGTSYTGFSNVADRLYASIPNDTASIYNIDVHYAGNKAINQGGTYSVNENDCKPTISGTVVDTNSSTVALTGDSSKFIKYLSKPKVTIAATPKKSASISVYAINLNDGQTSNLQEATFNSIGSNIVSVGARDSRGFSVSNNITLEMINYIKLAFKSLTIDRLEALSNEVILNASGVWFNGNFSSSNANSLTASFMYKEAEATEWTNGGTLTPTISGNTFSFTDVNLGNVFDANNEYQFKIIVSDSLMTIGSANTEAITVTKGQEIVAIGEDEVYVYGDLFVNEKIVKGSTVISPTEPTNNEEVWIQKSNNLLKFDNYTTTVNGITFTMENQILRISGTATAYTQAGYIPIKKTLEETETLTAEVNGSGVIPMVAYSFNGQYYYPNLYTLELQQDTYIDQIYFIIYEGANVNATVKLQLEKGNGYSGWQPYIDKKIYTKNDNGVYEELINTSVINSLIPQRIYPSFNWDYVYSTDLQYTCFKVGKMAFLNIHTLGFKSSVPNGTTIISGLPKAANNQYICMYLDGGNGDGLYSCRCLVTPGGVMNIHWGSPTHYGDSSNLQYRGFIMYETND